MSPNSSSRQTCTSADAVLEVATSQCSNGFGVVATVPAMVLLGDNAAWPDVNYGPDNFGKPGSPGLVASS